MLNNASFNQYYITSLLIQNSPQYIIVKAVQGLTKTGIDKLMSTLILHYWELKRISYSFHAFLSFKLKIGHELATSCRGAYKIQSTIFAAPMWHSVVEHKIFLGMEYIYNNIYYLYGGKLKKFWSIKMSEGGNLLLKTALDCTWLL